MKAKYVGDAKDFAKAFVFNLLRENLRGLKAVPLFTSDDGGKDIEAVLPTYASLLGFAGVEDVLLGSRLFPNDSTGRDDYFSAVFQAATSTDALFLDPDTGIKNGLSTKKKSQRYVRNREYVTFDELVRLLPSDQDRLLVVYDEAYARGSLTSVANAMRCKLDIFREAGVDGFGYFGNALNLVFLANATARRRLEHVQRILTEHLGSRADRVICRDGERVE